MNKSLEEIREKIKNRKGVVLTAEEFKKMACEKSPKELAKKVDVVTTATFSPMCSSGAFLNFGNCSPPIRMEEIFLNKVRAHGGIAAADAYIGAAQTSEEDPKYGGANVIFSLVKGEKILLEAKAKGTDCYPKKELAAQVSKDEINEAFLFNPRNAYQNYSAALNLSEKDIHTYMGTLRKKAGNINFCTTGELSPLINDPYLKNIGIGTKIFLCGAQGFICWNGTQHETVTERNSRGIPLKSAASISVIGDLKKMDPKFIGPAYFRNYGVSLFVGIGVPVPITDEDSAFYASVRNRDIEVPIADFSTKDKERLCFFTYSELVSGKVELFGRTVRTFLISGIHKSRNIACVLKDRILTGEFEVTGYSAPLPEGGKQKSLRLESFVGDETRKNTKQTDEFLLEEICLT